LPFRLWNLQRSGGLPILGNLIGPDFSVCRLIARISAVVIELFRQLATAAPSIEPYFHGLKRTLWVFHATLPPYFCKLGWTNWQ
jgi:hypothetical protein